MTYIGVIDSGVGGLTVLKEIKRRFPHYPTLYFGDQAYCPYGDQEESMIRERVSEMLRVISEEPIKVLVVACNTVASFLIDELKEKCPFPVISILHPVMKSLNEGFYDQIGVIATTKTIDTGVHRSLLHPSKRMYPLACPTFVKAIEECAPEEVLYDEVSRALYPLQTSPIQALVLGCTHFPIIAPVIQRVLGCHVDLIDPAKEMVGQLPPLLYQPEKREDMYITSGDPRLLEEHIYRLLGVRVNALTPKQHDRQF
ncbi:glutamate racemase (plasmid) [Pontibacillus sp. ALD_SL1]|uniref:glutamate racemase n=1 Tax=Pontibacillus sp. ALD_SL1 TaxID=2777185 RepID=UPI001A978F03|nr:glutamate racemase [Pontibacillus sp. ALD_SL1]QST02961.1 glutamate racemase [Pontibacillus sp. ALD_SL1]